jgi:hypothetical protein
LISTTRTQLVMIPDVVAAAMAAAIQYRPPMLLVAVAATPGQGQQGARRAGERRGEVMPRLRVVRQGGTPRRPGHEESDRGRAGTPGRSSWSSHPKDRA